MQPQWNLPHGRLLVLEINDGHPGEQANFEGCQCERVGLDRFKERHALRNPPHGPDGL
jgi:hypothetical protein